MHTFFFSLQGSFQHILKKSVHSSDLFAVRGIFQNESAFSWCFANAKKSVHSRHLIAGGRFFRRENHVTLFSVFCRLATASATRRGSDGVFSGFFGVFLEFFENFFKKFSKNVQGNCLRQREERGKNWGFFDSM